MSAALDLKDGADLFSGKALEDVKKGWNDLVENWRRPFLI